MKTPIFNKQNHTYEYEGIALQSVSSFKSSFSSFDKDFIASFVAKKQNKTVEEVLAEWKEKADIAIVRGKKIHDFAEKYLNDNTVTTEDIEEQVVLDCFNNDINNKYEIVYFEQPICSLTLKLAGTPDLIVKNKETDKFTIIDYKTNKDLFKATRSKLLAPFNDFLDTPYNTYAIQLSCYRLMLEEEGMDVEETIIIHFKPDNTYSILPKVIDFREEIKKYILNNSPDSWMLNH